LPEWAAALARAIPSPGEPGPQRVWESPADQTPPVLASRDKRDATRREHSHTSISLREHLVHCPPKKLLTPLPGQPLTGQVTQVIIARKAATLSRCYRTPQQQTGPPRSGSTPGVAPGGGVKAACTSRARQFLYLPGCGMTRRAGAGSSRSQRACPSAASRGTAPPPPLYELRAVAGHTEVVRAAHVQRATCATHRPHA
jgi:hypothetical protein